MKTTSTAFLGVFLLAWFALFATPTYARHHHQHQNQATSSETSGGGSNASVGEQDTGAGSPGKFDYYLLSLSWSPEFCLIKGAQAPQEQCGTKRFGFVVHGLWPQYERGYPQNCTSKPQPVPEEVATSVLPIMPSHDLIQHEWAKHGTCSGVSVNEYFSNIEKAFGSVNIPVELKDPQTAIQFKPGDLTDKFLKANASFPKNSTVINCKSGKLTEVHICLDKALQARKCAADVLKSQCNSQSIAAPPVK